MKHPRTSLLLLTLLASGIAVAQDITAEAYFNQASKEYVKQDKQQALRTLDQALQKYPGDPKLLTLAEELVKEEQKKQDQQQQQKEQQQQEEQEKKEQQKQEQQQQQGQEQEKQEQQQPKPEERAQQDPKNGQPRPGTIAPQDALRMLDALERSEKDVQEKVRAKRRPAVRRNIEKNW